MRAANTTQASKAACPLPPQEGAPPRIEALNSAIPPPSSAGLWVRIGIEPRVKQVALPNAVHPQVATRAARAVYTRLFQEFDRRRAGRQTGRFQAVQFELIEHEW